MALPKIKKSKSNISEKESISKKIATDISYTKETSSKELNSNIKAVIKLSESLVNEINKNQSKNLETSNRLYELTNNLLETNNDNIEALLDVTSFFRDKIEEHFTGKISATRAGGKTRPIRKIKNKSSVVPKAISKTKTIKPSALKSSVLKSTSLPSTGKSPSKLGEFTKRTAKKTAKIGTIAALGGGFAGLSALSRQSLDTQSESSTNVPDQSSPIIPVPEVKPDKVPSMPPATQPPAPAGGAAQQQVPSTPQQQVPSTPQQQVPQQQQQVPGTPQQQVPQQQGNIPGTPERPVPQADASGMTVLKTSKGKSFRVSARYARQFQGLVNDIESTGYNIKEIGGLRPGDPRWHGKGMAIDINPSDNPMIIRSGGRIINKITGADASNLRNSKYPFGYGKDNFPFDAGKLAAKWGLGWGGNWRSSSDTMHFSAGGNEGAVANWSGPSGSEITTATQTSTPASTQAATQTSPAAVSGPSISPAPGTPGGTVIPSSPIQRIQPGQTVPQQSGQIQGGIQAGTGIGSAGQLQPDNRGYVDQGKLYQALVERFRNSSLNGFKPSDGQNFGVTTGSPEEWARLALALGKQESSLHVLPNGGVRGGLYQFRQDDLRRYGVNANVSDPNGQLEAMARQFEKYIIPSGAIAGKGTGPGTYQGWRGGAAYFEPLRKPEQLQKHWASVGQTVNANMQPNTQIQTQQQPGINSNVAPQIPVTSVPGPQTQVSTPQETTARPQVASLTPSNTTTPGAPQRTEGGELPSGNIIALGKWLQSQGLRISENPAFGGVNPVHRGKGHYEGRAIDVNVGHGINEASDRIWGPKFDEIAQKARAAGYTVIWRAKGHFNHMHIEIPKGGPTQQEQIANKSNRISETSTENKTGTKLKMSSIDSETSQNKKSIQPVIIRDTTIINNVQNIQSNEMNTTNISGPSNNQNIAA